MKLLWGSIGCLSLLLSALPAAALEEASAVGTEIQNLANLTTESLELPEASTVGTEIPNPVNLTTESLEFPESSASPGQFAGTPLAQFRRNFNDDDRELTEIESIELGITGLQLLIKTSGSVRFQSQRLSGGVQQILFRNARLAENADVLQSSGRYISRVRIQQLDSRTVVLFIAPRAGYQVGSISQRNSRLVTVDLQEIAPATPSPSTRIPVPPPDRRRPRPPQRRVPRGRVVVAIDPGHGGRDPGAIGINGLQEKDVILPISLEVRSLLERQGIDVVMTRATDYFVSLEGRAQIANRARATIFVSIHANAVNRSNVSGVETFYLSSGRGLAAAIQESIIDETNSRNRGVKRARFYVLRHTAMPAALVEVGFVTGQEDSPRLADPEYRSRLANAIARGILRYLRR